MFYFRFVGPCSLTHVSFSTFPTIANTSVNLASRMESTGVPGRIQVTAAVVENLQKDEFTFEARGEIKVKGKGQMETFFLTERLKDYGAL